MRYRVSQDGDRTRLDGYEMSARIAASFATFAGESTVCSIRAMTSSRPATRVTKLLESPLLYDGGADAADDRRSRGGLDAEAIERGATTVSRASPTRVS